jgi:hypothetical protein
MLYCAASDPIPHGVAAVVPTSSRLEEAHAPGMCRLPTAEMNASNIRSDHVSELQRGAYIRGLAVATISGFRSISMIIPDQPPSVGPNGGSDFGTVLEMPPIVKTLLGGQLSVENALNLQWQLKWGLIQLDNASYSEVVTFFESRAVTMDVHREILDYIIDSLHCFDTR